MQGEQKFATWTDGTSNVIAFSEIYATCSNTGQVNGGTTYGSLWADSNSVWRPVFCTNSTTKNPASAGYPICLKFQSRPRWLTNCDTARNQAIHPGGIQVCVGDGSVRLLGDTVDQAVWGRFCDPQDGAAQSWD
jgi:hypothetical protein